MECDNTLRKVTNQRKLNIKELSEISGVSEHTLYKYVKCNDYFVRGRLKVFLKLSDGLCCDVEELLMDGWDPSQVCHKPTMLDLAIEQHYGAVNIDRTRRELRHLLGKDKDYMCVYRYSTYRDFPEIRDAYLIADYLGYSIAALWMHCI